MNLHKKFQLLMTFIFTLSVIPHANADEANLLSDIKPPQQASEYIFRSSPKESLISVQLLGAVQRPGIYYVPANTDLLKLLTLAGGSNTTGDVSEVLVRKLEPKTWAEIKSKAVNEYQGAFEVDAEKVIKYGGAKQLRLAQDDFVYVPPRSTFVSNEASKTLTVVSIALSIVLTGLLIQKNSEHN